LLSRYEYLINETPPQTIAVSNVREAARLFEFYRLSEVFAGHARDEDHPFPAIYPKANSPQAWSSSALFLILQSMLGIYPFAPLHTLIVDPHLPEWMPELTITNLRVGEAAADLRFFRNQEARASTKCSISAGISTYSGSQVRGRKRRGWRNASKT
jgi:hypothetical protein